MAEDTLRKLRQKYSSKTTNRSKTNLLNVVLPTIHRPGTRGALHLWNQSPQISPDNGPLGWGNLSVGTLQAADHWAWIHIVKAENSAAAETSNCQQRGASSSQPTVCTICSLLNQHLIACLSWFSGFSRPCNASSKEFKLKQRTNWETCLGTLHWHSLRPARERKGWSGGGEVN